jgi:hypothetical protein
MTTRAKDIQAGMRRAAKLIAVMKSAGHKDDGVWPYTVAGGRARRRYRNFVQESLDQLTAGAANADVLYGFSAALQDVLAYALEGCSLADVRAHLSALSRAQWLHDRLALAAVGRPRRLSTANPKIPGKSRSISAQ